MVKGRKDRCCEGVFYMSIEVVRGNARDCQEGAVRSAGCGWRDSLFSTKHRKANQKQHIPGTKRRSNRKASGRCLASVCGEAPRRPPDKGINKPVCLRCVLAAKS